MVTVPVLVLWVWGVCKAVSGGNVLQENVGQFDQ